jgi:hypothetical protein
MSLVLSSTDLAYGQNLTLTATLSYPASNPPNTRPGNYHILVDGCCFSGTINITETSPVVSFTTEVGSGLPGQHTATAVYVDPTTNVQVTSSPVTFTVEKVNNAFDCRGPNFAGDGQTMQFFTDLSVSFTPDWSDATITIKFIGPTTVISPPLVRDSNGNVTTTAPLQVGNYQVQCIFSGTKYFTAGQVNLPLMVSHNWTPGAVNLYSNPSPLNLATNKAFTLYIVFHPAPVYGGPSLPVPTGQVYFTFGNGTWGPGTLKSDGTLLAGFSSTVPFGNSVTPITVQYMGDTNYRQDTFTFSQKNPPIPANTGSGGSSNLGSGATVTVTPNPKATATATATAIATATTQSAPHASNSPTASVSAGVGPNWALIVGLIFAILALITGGVGGFLLWRVRRARLTGPSGAQSPYGQFGSYGQSSRYPQRDIGWNHSGAPTYPDQSQARAPTPRYRPSADDAQW